MRARAKLQAILRVASLALGPGGKAHVNPIEARTRADRLYRIAHARSVKMRTRNLAKASFDRARLVPIARVDALHHRRARMMAAWRNATDRPQEPRSTDMPGI